MRTSHTNTSSLVGKVDPGETRCQALMRELQEELDLDLEITEENYFDSVRHAYPDFTVTLHFFLCRIKDPVITLKEHTGYRWMNRADLRSLDWVPADEPIVRKLIG